MASARRGVSEAPRAVSALIALEETQRPTGQGYLGAEAPIVDGLGHSALFPRPRPPGLRSRRPPRFLPGRPRLSSVAVRSCRLLQQGLEHGVDFDELASPHDGRKHRQPPDRRVAMSKGVEAGAVELVNFGHLARLLWLGVGPRGDVGLGLFEIAHGHERPLGQSSLPACPSLLHACGPPMSSVRRSRRTKARSSSTVQSSGIARISAPNGEGSGYRSPTRRSWRTRSCGEGGGGAGSPPATRSEAIGLGLFLVEFTIPRLSAGTALQSQACTRSFRWPRARCPRQAWLRKSRSG